MGPTGLASLCWLLSSSPLTSYLPGRAIETGPRGVRVEWGPGGPWLGKSLRGQQGWGAAIAVEDRAYPPSATLPFVTLQIAPAWAGRGRNKKISDPLPTRISEPGGGCAFCWLLLSVCFWSLQHRELQEVLPESSLPHPFSKHLLSIRVLETHLSQPPLPRLRETE